MPIRLVDRLRARWRALRHGSALDRELARELDAHLDDQIEEHVDRGMSADEARRAAQRQFGLRGSIEEECREARGVSMVENVIRDVRYGWRALVRQPMLVAAAATSIGLGVAANLSVYAVANDLLLSVPSAREPDRLVHVRTGNGSHASYAAWRRFDESGAVAGMAGYTLGEPVNVQGRDLTATVTPLVVTPNFFELVGVPLARGRGFTSSEDVGGQRLAVVSDAFVRRQLGDSDDVVGRTMNLNGAPYTVIGLLPPGVRSLPGYGVAPDIYLPASPSLLPAMDRPTVPVVQLIGRLADGQRVAQARDALAAAASRIGSEIGDREVGAFLDVTSVGGFGQVKDFQAVGAFFVVLFAVSLLVLAIACANVAGLLLARGLSRGREIAMRLALGAGRRRLLQQLVTESLLLAVIGTAAGLALTWIVAQAVTDLALPLPVPIRINPVVDLRLVVAAGGLVVLTTLLCGVAPAWQITRPALLPSIRQEPSSRFGRTFSWRRVLVVGQVAISALLLMVALLFVRNLQRGASVDIGFDAGPLVVAQMTFVEGRQGPPESRRIDEVVERIRALPGVASAAHAEGVPLTLRFGSWKGDALRFGASDVVHAEYARNRVGPGYFETMGIRVAGRTFTTSDRLGTPGVAIVNEEFARRYFGDRDPIGLEIAEPGDPESKPVRVIGVAANGKYRMIGEAPSPALYEPMLQHDESERRTHVLIRTPSAAATMIPAIRQTMLEIDPSAGVAIEPMSSALAFAFLPSRIGAALVGVLGALGTLLAMVGLYGVLSFSVNRRTREIGLRMSLGASPFAVTRLVAGEAWLLVCLGTGLGLAIALVVTTPLAAFLVAGLETSDPASLAGAVGALLVLSLIAAWAPARRAIRIDPMRALRHD